MVEPDQLVFDDFPDFTPNLAPKHIFAQGSFGGTYWSPIFSTVLGQELSDQHLEFGDWWSDVPDTLLIGTEYDKTVNRYGVKSGTTLEMWESKGWIHPQDPYGWVQWYCRFYNGRRSEDDNRQIKRWKAFAGPRGRFRRQLISLVNRHQADFNDTGVSPVIRQSLQHWAYGLTEADFNA